MTTLDQLCRMVDADGGADSPLREACARPRSNADLRPLPDPQAESVFDSAWEILPAATRSAASETQSCPR
jgi:hypothetical protein